MPTKRYFFGADVGATKTHALIADQDGQCLGFAEAGGGNHQMVGYTGLREALQTAFAGASRMAGVGAGQIDGAGFGIAGYDWPAERQAHLECVAALGLGCPLEVANDALLGLLAGTAEGWGVCVTAGSSVNARGRDRSGREGRVVGNGAPFGEYGGGFEIVGRALQQVNYAWIRRGSPTALTQVFLDATGAKDEMDLMEGLSYQRFHLFPYLAVEVFRLAAQGDEVAGQVIRWAGEELGWLAVAILRQLGLEGEAVEVVQAGSIFDGGPAISNPMGEVIRRYAPRARLVRLQAPPVVGAVLLAMQAAGHEGAALRGALIAGAQKLVDSD